MSSMGSDGRRQSREELEEQVRYLEAEIHDLRHRLTEAPGGDRDRWSSGSPMRSARSRR